MAAKGSKKSNIQIYGSDAFKGKHDLIASKEIVLVNTEWSTGGFPREGKSGVGKHLKLMGPPGVSYRGLSS